MFLDCVSGGKGGDARVARLLLSLTTSRFFGVHIGVGFSTSLGVDHDGYIGHVHRHKKLHGVGYMEDRP